MPFISIDNTRASISRGSTALAIDGYIPTEVPWWTDRLQRLVCRDYR
jgi:hypothetical protein